MFGPRLGVVDPSRMAYIEKLNITSKNAKNTIVWKHRCYTCVEWGDTEPSIPQHSNSSKETQQGLFMDGSPMPRSGEKKPKRSLSTVNPYDGCRHGCLYCYARTIRRRRYDSWVNPKPRPHVLPQMKKDIKRIKAKGLDAPDVFLCSACDGYQPLELEHRLTREVLETLIENEFPFTLATKSDNVLRDIDLLKTYRKCRVGLTIITLDEEMKSRLEPYSPSIERRKDALTALSKEGIPTFCLMEPIMPTPKSDPFQIIAELKPYTDLFMLGKWSPYVKKGIPYKYDEDYYAALFKRLIPYCEDNSIPYCITPHSEEFLEKHRIGFRPYHRLTS